MEFDVVVSYPVKLSDTETRIINYLEYNKGRSICIQCLQNDLNINLGQSAGVIRDLRSKGYIFEEVKPHSWAKKEYCDKCGCNTIHYKYLGLSLESNERIPITTTDKKRIIKLLSNVDAFTGQQVSNPEVDHKTPHTVSKLTKKISDMSDDEIRSEFQILSRDHNLLKDRACSYCKKYGRRTPFFMGGQPSYYDGDSEYKNTCYGCGWYDGCAWRKASLEGTLKRDDKLFELSRKSKYGIESLMYLDKYKRFIESSSELNLKYVPELKVNESECGGTLFDLW